MLLACKFTEKFYMLQAVLGKTQKPLCEIFKCLKLSLHW